LKFDASYVNFWIGYPGAGAPESPFATPSGAIDGLAAI